MVKGYIKKLIIKKYKNGNGQRKLKKNERENKIETIPSEQSLIPFSFSPWKIKKTINFYNTWYIQKTGYFLHKPIHFILTSL